MTITKYLCISEEQANAALAAQPSPKEIEDAARRFALLGEPTRVRIALVLRETGELCVGDTAKVLDLKISLVSHHLRAFATHNLAEKRRDGKTRTQPPHRRRARTPRPRIRAAGRHRVLN